MGVESGMGWLGKACGIVCTSHINCLSLKINYFNYNCAYFCYVCKLLSKCVSDKFSQHKKDIYINTRLQLSDTSSIPSVHGGLVVWQSSSMIIRLIIWTRNMNHFIIITLQSCRFNSSHKNALIHDNIFWSMFFSWNSQCFHGICCNIKHVIGG